MRLEMGQNKMRKDGVVDAEVKKSKCVLERSQQMSNKGQIKLMRKRVDQGN